MSKRTTAREVALETIRDVFGSDRRRAQEAFDYRVRRADLDARDRAFAAELAYGVIKNRRLLDWLLAPYIAQRPTPLPSTILEVLRLGVYQLHCMGGVEQHAAVYETVNLALRHGHKGTAGLVNAVLRRVIADAPADPQSSGFADEDEYRAVRFSVPTWIVKRLREQFGADACEAILLGINEAPQHAIRVDVRRSSIEAVVAALDATGVKTSRSVLMDDVLICHASVSDDPDARWMVQSEGSCIPVDVLDPRPGERVVDMCSGRGHKTAQIAARVEDRGAIESIELDARKMRAQQALLARVGASCVASIVGDALAVPGGEDADAVLLDAPCSGLGILGRHPEARWRKAPHDAACLAKAQAALLRAAARRMKIGGRLVYSVCSTERCEGGEIIDAFLAQAPSFARRMMPARYASFARGEDLLIPPGIDGRDGFYIAMLERRV